MSLAHTKPAEEPARSFGPVARAGERNADGIRVSFEVFPPKTPEMEQSLWACIRRLADGARAAAGRAAVDHRFRAA